MVFNVLLASEAYESIKAEILEDIDDFLAQAPLVRKLARSFKAPNEDEIDHMLLDE